MTYLREKIRLRRKLKSGSIDYFARIIAIISAITAIMSLAFNVYIHRSDNSEILIISNQQKLNFINGTVEYNEANDNGYITMYQEFLCHNSGKSGLTIKDYYFLSNGSWGAVHPLNVNGQGKFDPIQIDPGKSETITIQYRIIFSKEKIEILKSANMLGMQNFIDILFKLDEKGFRTQDVLYPHHDSLPPGTNKGGYLVLESISGKKYSAYLNVLQF